MQTFFRVVHNCGRRYYSDSASRIGSRTFWKKRYDSSELARFDWLLDAEKVTSHILPSIEEVFKRSSEVRLNVLDAGCGTSEVSSLLLETSRVPIKIFCVDYAIGSLKWQQELMSDVQTSNIMSNYWLLLADVCKLPFPDRFFHVIIDKGTCDSLLKLDEKDRKTAKQMTREVLRTLSSSGKLIQITDEDPELRQNLLDSTLRHVDSKLRASWKLLNENPEYFMYTVESRS